MVLKNKQDNTCQTFDTVPDSVLLCWSQLPLLKQSALKSFKPQVLRQIRCYPYNRISPLSIMMSLRSIGEEALPKNTLWYKEGDRRNTLPARWEIMKSYSRRDANKMDRNVKFRCLDNQIFQGKWFLWILVLHDGWVEKTPTEHLFQSHYPID